MSAVGALLPLDAWRRNIGYNPWHFWQMSDSQYTPVSSSCNTLVRQYAWQAADQAGRYDILDRIQTAEERMLTYARFAPAPHYQVKTLQFPHYHDPKIDRFGYADPTGRWLGVNLGESKLQAIGLFTRELIETASVAYNDADSDGLNDSFTVSVATSVTNADQIAVYIQESDRVNGEPVRPRYRIAPLNITISGGTATIKGPRRLCVKPVLQEQADAIDPTDAGNFVTELEVYREYIDPSGATADTAQATLIWETAPYPAWANCCNDGSASRDPAALATGLARCVIRDAENGIIGVGASVYDSANDVWHSTNWSTCRPPDRITVRYQAGVPLVNQAMDHRWEMVIARLAAAEMPRRICACEQANRELGYWQFDMSLENAIERVARTDVLENPLGTKRGHVYAWQEIKYLRVLGGVAY